jgi:hypothetical protein
MATFVGNAMLLIAFVAMAIAFTVFNRSLAGFFARRFLQMVGFASSAQPQRERYLTVVYWVLLYIGSLFCAALAILFIVALLFGHQGQ